MTRVDYCNSALAGLSDSALAPLQRVLHAAARFVLDQTFDKWVDKIFVNLKEMPIVLQE